MHRQRNQRHWQGLEPEPVTAHSALAAMEVFPVRATVKVNGVLAPAAPSALDALVAEIDNTGEVTSRELPRYNIKLRVGKGCDLRSAAGHEPVVGFDRISGTRHGDNAGEGLCREFSIVTIRPAYQCFQAQRRLPDLSPSREGGAELFPTAKS